MSDRNDTSDAKKSGFLSWVSNVHGSTTTSGSVTFDTAISNNPGDREKIKKLIDAIYGSDQSTQSKQTESKPAETTKKVNR